MANAEAMDEGVPARVGLEIYPPSWYDKLSGWVDRLPGPNWAKYFGFVLILFLIGALLSWLDDPHRPIKLPPIAIAAYIQIGYILSLLDFIDKRAARSLDELRPLLKVDGSQYVTLVRRITTRPSKPMTRLSLSIAVIFGAFGVATLYTSQRPTTAQMAGYLEIFTRSASGYYAFALLGLAWFVNSIFIYSVVHLLRTIDSIYTNYTKINLFRQSELHAFSKLSATIAIGVVITSPLWIILDPGLITMGINIGFALLALFIFVSPLLGVRHLLKAQKDQLIRESNAKKEALVHDLFSYLEKKNIDGIKNTELALSSLEKAESSIRKIAVWPWQTETLRQVIGALLLPITIWVIQYFLGQVLSS